MTKFLVAESGIRQLQARYVDAVWRKDVNCFGDCFTEDAEWKITGLHLRGRAFIASEFGKFMDYYERVLIVFGSSILEVGEGSAIARTYCREILKFRDGRPQTFTIGTYYDRIVEEGDRWRFKWRQWDLCYMGPPDMSAALVKFKDYGPPPALPGPNDPATPPASEIF